MKGDEKGKPHISIPQKTAVAIVPPKKVRTFRFRPSSYPERPPAGKPRSVGLVAGWLPCSRASTNC